MVERSGDAEPLSLSARYPNASVAYRSIQPLRKSFDKLLELRLRKYLPDTAVIYLVGIDAERDIGPDGLVDQIDRLRDIADLRKPRWWISPRRKAP